ncbi:YceD family protein [Algibacillus agarilyticus]|uniref:YceD family protein n=1 Tax=Algibacillus agarilyticus TaxID=2234133 RepID=UPI0018E54192|nr:YceD family protein [Algibacillus agarilyticus]
MPIDIEPGKSAQKRSDYSGVYRLEDLKRLKETVNDSTGIVTVTLSCKQDEQGLTVLLVDAQTDVRLPCERCGSEFELHLKTSGIFTPESKKVDEDIIPSTYEIVATDEYGFVALRDLVEDELLLAIPIFPKHDENDCLISQGEMSWGDIGEDEPSKPNPFDVLKKLKSQ